VSATPISEPVLATTAEPADRVQDHSLRETWPIHRRQTILLVGGCLLLTLVWIAVGKLITGPLDDSALVRRDERVADWMVAQRTPTWDRLTLIGSYLAETVTKVAVTAILALVLLKLWRRWFEPMVLVVSLVIEASAFIIATNIVDRPRPDVPHLDGSPVGTSFPSGHAAAAAVYVAFAVVLFWHTRSRWARGSIVVVTALIPVIVSLSRMYRGMHFLSDTVAGVILGLLSVLLTVRVLARSPEGSRTLADVRAARDSTCRS
jgi:undecaprenyl-diphosphatase